MKICIKCSQTKPNNEFPKDKQRKDDLHPYCKSCKAEQQRVRNKVESEARRRLPKRCRKCNKLEPEVDFPSRQSHNCWACHEKQANISISHQRRTSKIRYSRKKKYIRLQCSKRTEFRKKLLILHKGGKCNHCNIKLGTEWPTACFDFHHIEDKEAILGKLIHSWQTKYGQIIKELDKCILLCSNCHRKLHFYEKRRELDNESSG